MWRETMKCATDALQSALHSERRGMGDTRLTMNPIRRFQWAAPRYRCSKGPSYLSLSVTRDRSFHVLRLCRMESNCSTACSILGLLLGSSCTISSTRGFKNSNPILVCFSVIILQKRVSSEHLHPGIVLWSRFQDNRRRWGMDSAGYSCYSGILVPSYHPQALDTRAGFHH